MDLSQFSRVWLWDFEFRAPTGEVSEPLCLVAREWRTGQTLRLWQDELAAMPPLTQDRGALFVAYYASAELGCVLSLGWPLPAHVLDLYAEFRCLTSGLPTPCGHSLLGALSYYGLDGLSAVEKDTMRQLAMRGGPFTDAERSDLLAYCESDVIALDRLLPAMLPRIDLPRALLRGRYMGAAARMERNGVPIDTAALAMLREQWDTFKSRLIVEVDRDYRVFVPTGQQLNPESRFGAAVLEEAKDAGVDPYRLAAAASSVWAEERQRDAELFEARQAARRATGLTRTHISDWEDAGHDYSDWPGLDVAARELASRFPALGIGTGYSSETGYDDTDYAGRLWAVLRDFEDKPKPRHDPAILRRAAELVRCAPDEVYGDLTFSTERWAAYLSRKGIAWPVLDSGALDLSRDTFREMSRSYPKEIAPMAELRYALSQLRLNELAVGSDGRNRVVLSAFAARTGRNQPSNSRFVFGPATWLRGLIRPAEGRAVAYCDWEQQEFGIAAALSGDTAMMDAYRSGDPYLTVAKQAGAVPAHGTKATHKAERERFKTLVLAVQYCMSAESLAARLNESPARGRELLRLHRETYPRYWRWADAVEMTAFLHGQLRATFGWTVHVGPDANPRSLRNFPLQANGAEMLRLACILATERGIPVCCPVHDALLVEGTLEDIEDVVAATQEAMRQASEIVLPGFPLRTDAKIVRYPDRYMDPRGAKFWDTVWSLVERETWRPSATWGGVGTP